MIRFWEIPYAFGIALVGLAVTVGVALIVDQPTVAGLALIVLGLVLGGKGLVALTVDRDYWTVNPLAWNIAVFALFVFGAAAVFFGVSSL